MQVHEDLRVLIERTLIFFHSLSYLKHVKCPRNKSSVQSFLTNTNSSNCFKESLETDITGFKTLLHECRKFQKQLKAVLDARAGTQFTHLGLKCPWRVLCPGPCCPCIVIVIIIV